MKQIINRNALLLGLAMAILRIVIGKALSYYHLEGGYFIDIIMLICFFVWPFFVRGLLSFMHIFLSNSFIAVISIIVFDVYLLIFKNNSTDSFFFLKRLIVALTVLGIAFFASVCCFLVKDFLRKGK